VDGNPEEGIEGIWLAAETGQSLSLHNIYYQNKRKCIA